MYWLCGVVVAGDFACGDLPVRCSECHQVGSHSAWCSSAAVSPSAEKILEDLITELRNEERQIVSREHLADLAYEFEARLLDARTMDMNDRP